MATDAYSETHTLETLNVFLHGTFVFLDYPGEDNIRAVIPKIDHHIYRAGSWLGETDLQAGKYGLKEVEKGSGTFDDSRNLILQSPEAKLNADLAYATLILPRPDTIFSLRVAKISPGSFENTEGLGLDSKGEQIATLQVFAYRFGNDAKLFLETAGEGKNGQDGIGHYWEPVFSGDSINLHIFSGEDHHEGSSYAAADFQTCMRLLGLNLRLKRAYSASGIGEDEILPAGVSAEETEDLAPRTSRLARLGRLVREKGDLNQAWYKNDALDDDPPNCGSFVHRP